MNILDKLDNIKGNLETLRVYNNNNPNYVHAMIQLTEVIDQLGNTLLDNIFTAPPIQIQLISRQQQMPKIGQEFIGYSDRALDHFKRVDESSWFNINSRNFSDTMHHSISHYIPITTRECENTVIITLDPNKES
jgi:hypothetical protein